MDDITLIADGVRPVTLRRPGSDLTIGIAKALLRPFRSRRQLTAEDIVVPKQLGNWFLSVNALPDEPRPGDCLDDNDRCWIVTEVHRSELNETWQCVAQTYSIQFGLDEFVDHLKTAYTKSSGGILQRGFRTEKTGIGAKFSGSVRTLLPSDKDSLFILIREKLDVQPKDVFRRSDGTMYEIEKVKQPLFKSDWTEIEARKINS